ncbi:MAG: polysaccharide deacetylase family protein [Chloroflexota bacterium]|nr:polysaccharide deacetylase family protein [Chloroflexota bacterium]
MTLPGLKGLGMTARRLRYAFEQRVLILLYHRIVTSESDLWNLSVTPHHFDEHLQVLQHFRTMELQQLARALRAGSLPRRAVVITFDDGYADNLYNAKPLLERYDIPATVFLVSGSIGHKREFWWDELERVLLQPDVLPRKLCLTINGSPYVWEASEGVNENECRSSYYCRPKSGEATFSPRRALYYSLWERLHALPHNEQQKVLDALLQWAGAGAASRPTHRTLEMTEVQRLAEGGLIEIGAHTATHSSLAVLPLDAQRDEIRRSRTKLEEILNAPVQSFAYPYGSELDYTPETRALVQQAGFACACSNFGGVVRHSTDIYQLPRMRVENWDGEEFSRRIERWFHE